MYERRNSTLQQTVELNFLRLLSWYIDNLFEGSLWVAEVESDAWLSDLAEEQMLDRTYLNDGCGSVTARHHRLLSGELSKLAQAHRFNDRFQGGNRRERLARLYQLRPGDAIDHSVHGFRYFLQGAVRVIAHSASIAGAAGDKR